MLIPNVEHRIHLGQATSESVEKTFAILPRFGYWEWGAVVTIRDRG
jgi:hypothetical protein